MCHIQLFGIRFYISNEFLQIFWWKVLPCHDKERLLGDHTNWLEIDIRLKGEVGVKGDREGMGPCVTHLDGVPVGFGAHCPYCASSATGPSYVLDDELLSERARHVLADDAGSKVGVPARGERINDRDGTRRIGLRPCDTRHRQRGSARGQMQEFAAGKFHFEPSLTSLDRFEPLNASSDGSLRALCALRSGLVRQISWHPSTPCRRADFFTRLQS